jgi:hypothetical protein
MARVGSRPNLPLLGFVTVRALLPAPSEIAPSSTWRSGVHSRSALRLRFGVEGATLAACSAPVVSHHLGGFLLRTHAGLLHPATDPGVRRVSGAVRLGSSRSGDLSPSRPSPSPRRSFRTLRRMSSTAAVPRHRGPCLPGVPPPFAQRASPTRRLLRSRVVDTPPPLPAMLRPLPSWAFFPFKVLRSRWTMAARRSDRPWSESLWEFAVSTGRSLSSCAPGVCPEPKFVSPKRHRPSWGS